MRLVGIRELSKLIYEHDEDIIKLLPFHWTHEQREYLVKSDHGKALIIAVLGVVCQQLKRIEYEDQHKEKDCPHGFRDWDACPVCCH